MLLGLLACAVDAPDPRGPVEVREWLYGDVTVPEDDAIVGAIQVEHDGNPVNADGAFWASAYFVQGEPRTRTQPWADPFDGVGDCGLWTEPPVMDGENVPADVGTVFLDAGLGEPFAIPNVGGTYVGGTFEDAGWGPPDFGAVFAVAAVGGDYPAFDWDPGMALPLAAMQVTAPANEATVAATDALDVAWIGEDPHAVVVVELSDGGQQGVYCEAPDAGAFTIPAGLMAGFESPRIGLYVTRRLDRYEEIAPGAYVRLRTQTENRLRLLLE